MRIITRRVCKLPTVPLLVFLGLFVIDLCATPVWQTHYVTLRCDRDLWRWNCHSTYRWYGSSYFICVPSLKFVGLSVRKIWRTTGLNISRPDDLDPWPWNWYALLPVRCATFLTILVFLGRFVLDLSVRCVTWPCDLDQVWPCSFCVPSLKFVRLLIRKILHICCASINRPGDLDLF